MTNAGSSLNRTLSSMKEILSDRSIVRNTSNARRKLGASHGQSGSNPVCRRLRIAVTGTLQHAQIGAPRADCITILVGHHARYLMQMREVMNGPCRQEFGERHRSKFRMHSVARQVFRLQIQCLERSQILFTQASELVEELLERLALTLFYLRQAVKGIEGPRFAVLEDDASARHPVG